MTGEQRVEIAFRLTRTVRELSVEGIRNRHPEYDSDQVRWASLRLWLGQELFARTAPTLAP